MVYHQLNLDLQERSYPIIIGRQILENKTLISSYLPNKQVLIVTNETVAPLYLNTLQTVLSDYQCLSLVLSDGEQYKNLTSIQTIYDKLILNHFERKCTLIALGGGVIGDMTGFAAACYLRGVAFMQIPTTLLAQVDSSVGGKTGVNHPLGKNLIGAFHQPKCVISDLSTLQTLSQREFAAGMAEIIKVAAIYDASFFVWLENNLDQIMQMQEQALAMAIYRACAIKADIVAADEREAGIRAYLNFGHTFGHAIESSLGYSKWLHGEAVAAGMVAAAQLSVHLNFIAKSDYDRLVALIKRANLPERAPKELSTEQLLSAMKVDKKVVDKKIRLVLLKNIGTASLCSEYGEEQLVTVIEAWRA
jgi:3-dehydroquinate synthase